MKWSRDVSVEERREKFYSASCNGNIKSKVSICQKKGKRPDWTVRLEMLKTPKMRKAILQFLNDIQVYVIPKKNLNVLAKKNHWRKVLFLDEEALRDYDTDKTGAGKEKGAPTPAVTRKKAKKQSDDLDMMPAPKNRKKRRSREQIEKDRRELSLIHI